MELDDFKNLWNDYDRKLIASMRLNTLFLQQTNLSRVQTSLNALSRGLTFEVVLNVIAILLIGSFAGDRAGEARFFFPAILLGAYAVAVTAAAIYQLVQIRALDYDEPVVAIQQKLEHLKIQRIATTKWTFLSAFLMWVPFLIVALKGLFGVDAYRALGLVYLTVNAVAGIAVIPLGLWFSKRFGKRISRTVFGRTLVDDLAGRSLATALASLDAIRRFEAE